MSWEKLDETGNPESAFYYFAFLGKSPYSSKLHVPSRREELLAL
jgi:hypothetical protein